MTPVLARTAGLASLVLTFGLAACSSEAVGGQASPPAESAPAAAAPVPVEVTLAQTAGGAHSITATGLVRFKRETALAFAAPGQVESLRVDEGDAVRKGQVVATLRRTTAGADASEAALARRTAEQALARTQDLHAKGLVSDAALDAARLGVERARDTAVLTAPADGVVVRRSAEPSQVVAGGQPLLWLGETGAGLVVRAVVPVRQAARIRAGQTVGIVLSGARQVSGEVAFVAPEANPVSGGVDVEIRLAASIDARSGDVARVSIQADPDTRAAAAPEVLLAPMMALTDARADQATLFVVDEAGRAHRRSVQTAGLDGEFVTIVSGLSAGERIVTRGASSLRDGQAVTIVAADPSR